MDEQQQLLLTRHLARLERKPDAFVGTTVTAIAGAVAWLGYQQQLSWQWDEHWAFWISIGAFALIQFGFMAGYRDTR